MILLIRSTCIHYLNMDMQVALKPVMQFSQEIQLEENVVSYDIEYLNSDSLISG